MDTTSLPEQMLTTAEVLGLVVEEGAILYESEIGGGLLVHNWLSQREEGICISTEILTPLEEGQDEYKDLLPMSTSGAIDEATATSVIERWGLLKQLELSFDAQKMRAQIPAAKHDAGLENDNLD